MKICIISNFYPPFFFGGERAVQREAEALGRRGHEVTVITSSPTRKSYTEEMNGVTVHRFFPFNLYPPYQFQNKPRLAKAVFHMVDLWNPFSYRAIKKLLQRANPEVVYIHNFKGLSMAVFSAVKGSGLSCIFCVNDYSLMCPRANLLRSSGEICNRPSLLCRIYSQAQKHLLDRSKPDVVVSPAQFTIDKLRAADFFTGVNTKREVVGVELNKKRIVKDYAVFNILYVGGVNKHKGVHILVDAVIKLRQANARLHIVGRGQDTDEMRRLAGDDARITFYGFVTDDKLLRLRERANISVVPSIWYDMAQGVICESFGSGTPVVGSRIGGIPELIEEGYNGHLFEAGNSAELRAILEGLINNPGELRELEEGAFASSKKYDIEHHISRLEEIYKSLVK